MPKGQIESYTAQTLKLEVVGHKRHGRPKKTTGMTERNIQYTALSGRASLRETSEACIGVLGIQDICLFTSRDIGYYPFYFQGYGIHGPIFSLLPGILKI